MIDMDKLDPDWDLAERHGEAWATGKPSQENKHYVCPCCLQIVQRQPVSLLESPKQLQFLGFGFPLYFTFTKYCIILLLIFICSYSFVQISKAISFNISQCQNLKQSHQNLEQEQKNKEQKQKPVKKQPHHFVMRHFLKNQQAKNTHRNKQQCQSWIIKSSSIEQQVTTTQNCLRIGSFIIHLLFLIYMRDNLCKLEGYYDERTTSLSDYSIIIKKIPHTIRRLQTKLRQFFMQEFTNQHKIMELTLLPQHSVITSLQKQMHEVQRELKKHYKSSNFGQEFFKKQNKMENLKKQIEREFKRVKKLIDQDRLTCSRVIIVLNTEMQKNQVLEEFEEMSFNKKKKCFENSADQVFMTEAPQPKQILWENIDLSGIGKKFKRIKVWLICLLVLLIVTVIFYIFEVSIGQRMGTVIEKLHQNIQNSEYIEEYKKVEIIIIFTIFSVVLFNKLIMVNLFHKLTDLQCHSTRSRFQFSFALKYCLGLFFTTAIMTLAVEAITLGNYYKHPFGVIQEETIMFFMNALFVPLFWLINPVQLMHRFKRWRMYGKNYLTQAEANQLMQDSPYEIGKRYAQIIETMWFIFLYATVLPIGACISVVGLALYYWVDKLNLLRRSVVEGHVSGKLVLKSMNLLDFTLFLKPCGEIIFDNNIRNGVSPYSICMAIIAIIYIISPTNEIIQFFNNEKFKPQLKTFQETKSSFQHTYLTEHPIFKLFKQEKLRKKFKEKGLTFVKIKLDSNNQMEKHQFKKE